MKRKTATSALHKPRAGSAGPRSAGRLQGAIDAVVRREIGAALRESRGNVAAAARALGITEMAIRKRLRSLRINPNAYR
jgi:transcriptional regulator with GAF, ATPase, and Fis domain